MPGRRRRRGSASVQRAIAIALVVAGLPGLATGALSPATALAKQDGSGNGNSGNGGGQQRGGGHDTGAVSGRSDQPGRGPAAGTVESKSSSAASLGRAQERYARTLERKTVAPSGHGLGGSGGRKEPPDAAHEFSAAETGSLVDRGWRGPKSFDDSFANHGQRVSTMVGIARALGYPASVGAMQANFGTPFENGVHSLEVSLAAAKADQSAAPADTSLAGEIERLTAGLVAAIGLAKPGAAPDESWAAVDLDVNNDLVVDQRDLEVARAQTAAADGEGKP